MFKIAVFPKCYVDEIVRKEIPLFDWIDMAKTLGVEGLELYPGFLDSYHSDYLKQVRRYIEENNLKMPMMCYSSDFTFCDDNRRKEEIKKQKEIIEVTAELGGRYCRVLSGQRRPEISIEDGVRWVVESIIECLLTAKNYDIMLVMENHYKDGYWEYPEFAQKKEVFLSIINQIDSPNFGIQYDPSNTILAGDDPIDLLHIVKHSVKTMHASDRYLEKGVTLDELRETDGTIGYSPKLRHGVTGKGLNDYNTIFSILRETDFSDWISIEDGVGMEEMRESVEFLQKMRKKYFGDGI